MSESVMPVTPRDLRQALGLCAAKFETEAAELRESVRLFERSSPAVARRRTEKADSFDRMAASARALVRAPDDTRQGYAARLSVESFDWFRNEYLRLAESHMEADSQFDRDETRRKVELLRAVSAFRFEGKSLDE